MTPAFWCGILMSLGKFPRLLKRLFTETSALGDDSRLLQLRGFRV